MLYDSGDNDNDVAVQKFGLCVDLLARVNTVSMNKTSSIAKRASLGTSTKCNNLMSWLKQKEPSLENKTTTKISFVEKKNTLESGKEDIVPAPQSSAEYLRSLVEDTGWRKVLLVEFRKEYMNKIVKFLQKEKEKVIFKK
ncbi:unnamed protein product [Onchocerca flexuosa]|uniref:Uncharacterized protein n=1 Tax=Onchocerca flexuosa TaxID=387005 RepID=A0A183H3L4_9BILA|nr:unnamed protein product [Onchocerca flexuosa]